VKSNSMMILLLIHELIAPRTRGVR
jgi:hypothetical protein